MRHLHATVLILCAAFGFAQAQPSYTLKYKFAEGKAYRYADTTVAAIVQEMMGQEVKVDTRAYAVTRLVAEKGMKDGLLPVVMSLEKMTRSTKSPRQDTTMEMADFLNKKSRALITPSGDVKKWEIVDSIKITNQMGTVNASTREFFRVAVLSEKPVKVGEKWTNTKHDSVDAMGGKMATDTQSEFTLGGVETVGGRKCLKLSYTGKVSMNGKSVMMGMDIFTEGGGTISGTIWFDDKAGVIVRAEGKTALEMTAAVTGAQNMTIPITQSSTYASVLLPE